MQQVWCMTLHDMNCTHLTKTVWWKISSESSIDCQLPLSIWLLDQQLLSFFIEPSAWWEYASAVDRARIERVLEMIQVTGYLLRKGF